MLSLAISSWAGPEKSKRTSWKIRQPCSSVKEKGKEKDNEKGAEWTLEEKTERGVWERIAVTDRQEEDNEKGKGWTLKKKIERGVRGRQSHSETDPPFCFNCNWPTEIQLFAPTSA
jgi:hypothetical protein